MSLKLPGRRLAVTLVVGVAVVAGAIYFRHAFSPRERADIVSPEFAALLAASSPFEHAIWIAHPHQNLGALDERVGDLELYLAELSQLTGITRPRLPSFGPFALPPARELVLAWNGSGESFLAVARIEPGIGWAGRLAGRLAGNPWLTGGRILSGGRSFEVRWRGPLWIVASGVPAELDPPAPEGNSRAGREVEAPAIAQLMLRHEVGPLQSGRFVLARGDDGLEVRSGVLPEASPATSDWDFPGVVLWLSTTDRGPIGGPGLFLLWAAPEGVIPRIAVLQRGGGRSFRLPGESLLELVGAAEPALRLGWTVRGTQNSARREALLMVPWFERHLPRPGERGAWLGRAGRLAPGAGARTLEALLGSLEKLPLIPAAELQRISAATRLLAPFGDCTAIAFEVWHDPEGGRLRLCSRGLSPGAEPEEEWTSSPEDGEIDGAPPIR